MNFIVVGFHKKILFPIISKTLKYFNVRYVHLTYKSIPNTNVPPQTKVVFHDVRDLQTGSYNINWGKIIPLDEDLIEKMNDCEVVVLKMMDRLPLGISSSYCDRKRIYLKHLRYWNHIIEKNKIDLFLSSNIPHEVYDFVIYSLCKLKKIPTIFFNQINISDTVTIMEDWEPNIIAVQDKYQRLLKKYQYLDKSKIPLHDRFKRDFELNTAEKVPVRPEMLRKKPSHSIIKNLFPLFASLNFNRFLFLIRNPKQLKIGMIDLINYADKIMKEKKANKIMKEKKLLKFYKSNTIKPDLSQKYIYFPLHLQPELSTSPMAGAYVNQVLIAQMIGYYLPKDVYIFIKENPHQTAVGRDKEFYRELLEISQVRFIPDNFNTYDLIENSLAVATATGTAGLEALYRCKPVLMFGHNFYQYANGVFRIKSNFDCQQALNKILLDNFRPTIKDIKIFLKALEGNTVEGFVDVNYKKYTYVTDSISNKNILEKLINEIKKTCHL
jgi:hypothetical protein